MARKNKFECLFIWPDLDSYTQFKKNVMNKTIFSILFIILFSCKKSVQSLPNSNYEKDYPKRAASTSKEIQIVQDIKKITPVLMELYKNKDILEEINSAIFSQYYQEEQVLLSDLLYPEQSLLYQKNKIKNKGSFSREFRVIYNKLYGIPDNISSYSTNLNSRFYDGYLENENLGIYFPYSENFILSSTNLVALTPTEFESDFGEGYIFDHVQNAFKQVLVSDDFAYSFPVHIIFCADNLNVNSSSNQSSISDNPSVNIGNSVLRVFHGFGRLNRQLDPLIGFINSGGSEIVVGRISGYLERADGHVKNFKGDLARLHYTRKAIREHRWVRAYSVWDSNWKIDDNEQVYCVYEEDNSGSSKFSGKLKTKLSTGVESEIGFEIKVKTEDPIQAQLKQSRTDYLRTAKKDQGHGFLTNPADNTFLTQGHWPIYNGGINTNWAWTWPYTWF